MYRFLVRGLCVMLCAGAGSAPAVGADFPTQPIRLMVGYPAGGSVDIVARVYAQRLITILSQPVVVENRGGASGAIAAQAVAKAAPDGYTLYFVASPTVTLTPAMQKTAYDPIKDFQAIASVVNYALVLLVNSGSPYKTVADVVKQAREQPGSVTYGSSGVGASNHLSGELLADKAGVKLTHVPYKGNAPATTDLIAGRITFLFDTINTAINQIKGGKVRALAVSSAERNPMFPEVPTMIESGYKDLEFTGWLGVLGPAGMSKLVVQTLATATQKILADPAFRAGMAVSGYSILESTPDELLARMAREGKMFTDLVQRANLRQE